MENKNKKGKKMAPGDPIYPVGPKNQREFQEEAARIKKAFHLKSTREAMGYLVTEKKPQK